MTGLPSLLPKPSEESVHSKTEKNGKGSRKKGKTGKDASDHSVTSITTAKCTTAHEMTIDARENAYKV